MADSKVVAEKPSKANKIAIGMLFPPRTAQWVLVGVLLVLFGLSRTEGAVGTFLRSFSTFLFP